MGGAATIERTGETKKNMVECIIYADCPMKYKPGETVFVDIFLLLIEYIGFKI